ncbi:hypothetical protein B0H17DRAFT_1138446 [Mycena rosella]|uniref:Chitin-binding type-2 domain-containing protein n=1 Tax=Mycena rosella TaxID=1033263 RepID=A0AAD7D9V7_MYCRO|nr:hypothetical protein B0H17DRAFT_1138446 [Mycena rosella]
MHFPIQDCLLFLVSSHFFLARGCEEKRESAAESTDQLPPDTCTRLGGCKPSLLVCAPMTIGPPHARVDMSGRMACGGADEAQETARVLYALPVLLAVCLCTWHEQRGEGVKCSARSILPCGRGDEGTRLEKRGIGPRSLPRFSAWGGLCHTFFDCKANSYNGIKFLDRSVGTCTYFEHRPNRISSRDSSPESTEPEVRNPIYIRSGSSSSHDWENEAKYIPYAASRSWNQSMPGRCRNCNRAFLSPRTSQGVNLNGSDISEMPKMFEILDFENIRMRLCKDHGTRGLLPPASPSTTTAACDRRHGLTAPGARVPCPFRQIFLVSDHTQDCGSHGPLKNGRHGRLTGVQNHGKYIFCAPEIG